MAPTPQHRYNTDQCINGLYFCAARSKDLISASVSMTAAMGDTKAGHRLHFLHLNTSPNLDSEPATLKSK